MTEPVAPPVDTDLPDELPPVRPPSVGFIFQLFVVPALIVAAVIAAWLLFGRLASGEQDWESLLAGITSPNHHIRYRSMEGLATVLDSDRRLGEQGKHLAGNSRIAQTLSEELKKKLASTSSSSEETLKDEMFLTRALGSVDFPEFTIPPLLQALQSTFDEDVRKSAITSLALIAGREWERQKPLTGKDVSEGVIEFSMDADPHLRRAAAFTLGLIETPDSSDRLHVLLEDADWMTTVNAAIALARRGSPDGYPVFAAILAGKIEVDPEASNDASASASIVYHNVLNAVSALSDKFSPEQRSALTDLVSQLSTDHAEVRIRTDAQSALTTLQKSP